MKPFKLYLILLSILAIIFTIFNLLAITTEPLTLLIIGIQVFLLLNLVFLSYKLIKSKEE